MVDLEAKGLKGDKKYECHTPEHLRKVLREKLFIQKKNSPCVFLEVKTGSWRQISAGKEKYTNMKNYKQDPWTSRQVCVDLNIYIIICIDIYSFFFLHSLTFKNFLMVM